MNIEQNLTEVRERIVAAAARCGRDADDIRLVAVTKTYPIDAMNEAIRCGVTDIGENKPQEIRDKYPSVLPVRWHLIGHLQSNKVKYVVGRCALIHSVDSVKIMDEIERQSARRDVDTDILIEVNISGEKSKSGIAPDTLPTLLEHSGTLSRTHVKGLMTVAPKAEYGDVGEHFARMKELFDRTKEKEYKNVEMAELSMGMSGDFEQAIKYGSTMVRIGSAIFGARHYDV